jgi:hypothetical protein
MVKIPAYEGGPMIESDLTKDQLVELLKPLMKEYEEILKRWDLFYVLKDGREIPTNKETGEHLLELNSINELDPDNRQKAIDRGITDPLPAGSKLYRNIMIDEYNKIKAVLRSDPSVVLTSEGEHLHQKIRKAVRYYEIEHGA